MKKYQLRKTIAKLQPAKKKDIMNRETQQFLQKIIRKIEKFSKFFSRKFIFKNPKQWVEPNMGGA